MGADTTAAPAVAEDGEIMASVDGDGPGERLVIADISRDGAWLSVALGDAATLPERE
jgi:hypothetical protein